jgi:hypothetical protein
MPRTLLAGIAFACVATSALAGNAFVLPDGVSRAPAVVLHCVTDDRHAAPCGTASQPIVVVPLAGGATASNQATEIGTQQSLATGLGTPGDAAYGGSGSATVVSLLKAVAASSLSGVPALPTGGLLTSRSAAVTAQASTVLFAANPQRRYLAFQAPFTTAIWVNLMGGQATPNGVDCVYFSAGSFYESSGFVNRGAITFYAPVAVTISAWEG